MLEQLAQPLGVCDVGLAAGHVLDVRGVDQEQLEVVLEQVVDRLPVDARGLHRDVGNAKSLEPVTQREQVGGHGLKLRAQLGGSHQVLLLARQDALEWAVCFDPRLQLRLVRLRRVDPAGLAAQTLGNLREILGSAGVVHVVAALEQRRGRAPQRAETKTARSRRAAKRDGGYRLTIDAALEFVQAKSLDLVLLDDALDGLTRLDARQSRIVELRFFGGLSIDEVSKVLGISANTVKREWATARIWLHHEMSRGAQK